MERASKPVWLFLPAAAALLLLAGCEPPAQPPEPPKPIAETTPAEPDPTPEAAPEPTPTPAATPFPYIPRKNIEVSRFYNGITIESELTLEDSEWTAAVDRNRLDSYVLEMNLRIRFPEPAQTVEQFQANDPEILRALPSLPELLDHATVSPSWTTLFENKVNYIRPRLGRLEEILSRHNFYDCDTILEMRHPETGRKAVYISSDMDLNVDGSDGDRNVEIDGSSRFFQPQTSYRWPKQTDRPNQFLAATEERLAEVRKELADPELEPERKRSLENSEQTLRNRLLELQRWSFLISDTDPYIVLPGFMFRSNEGPFQPSFGDYAVVIYDDTIYPAIVGDAGPSFKMGEASMRICQELNPRTSGIQRAVSNIRVAYIVFPGSADDRGPPDLDRWNTRCRELFAEIGGDAERVFEWEDIVPPWPTPTPEPEENDEEAADPEPPEEDEASTDEAGNNS